MDLLGFPFGAEPSAEDLGWAFAAVIAIAFLSAVPVIGWLLSG